MISDVKADVFKGKKRTIHPERAKNSHDFFSDYKVYLLSGD